MEKEITINYLYEDKRIFKVAPLEIKRSWMTDTREKFAYKCLPLNIANQYGWAVLSPYDFSVSWYGGTEKDSVQIEFDGDEKLSWAVASHFGEAVLTLQVDFIIQTPENYSTYVRGIPNKDYQMLKPLDAIIETDWLPFTFTYNFKFMDIGTISFKKDEPLFSFFPIERNTIENFNIRSTDIKNNKILHSDYLEYAKSRESMFYKKTDGRMIFQKFYINGRGPNKIYNIKNHIKKLLFKDVE